MEQSSLFDTPKRDQQGIVSRLDVTPSIPASSVSAQLQTIPLNDGQLYFLPQWLSPTLSEQLQQSFSEQLQWEQSMIQMYGKPVQIPRLNAWYGDADAHYHYSGLPLPPLDWHPQLEQLKQWLEATVNAIELPGPGFNSVLANLYRDGNDSVAWHSDDEHELGVNSLIASVSLGVSRTFSLQHKRDKRQRFELILPSGSLLLMAGATQHHWRHALLKEKSVNEARINLTYRYIWPIGLK